MQSPTGLSGSTRLHKHVRPVVRLQIVSGISREDPGLHVREAPVGAYVQDPASQSWAGEVAAHDRNRGPDSAWTLRGVDVCFAPAVEGVEEAEAGSGGD